MEVSVAVQQLGVHRDTEYIIDLGSVSLNFRVVYIHSRLPSHAIVPEATLRSIATVSEVAPAL